MHAHAHEIGRNVVRYLCGSRGAELVTAALSTDENADALAGSMRLANLRNSLIPCSGLAGRLRIDCDRVSASLASTAGATSLVTSPSASARAAVIRSRVYTRCATVL